MTILQRYNGLDSIATRQLWHVLKHKLLAQPDANLTYQEHKALTGPFLYAMTRGILVDREMVASLNDKFTALRKLIEAKIDIITRLCGLGVINFASPVQVKWMFACFGADIDSSNMETLEQLAVADLTLRPLCKLVLLWRNLAKMLTVLQPEITDADGRMRCTYKVAGTVTDRLSSSKNALWTGMNMQNIKRDEDEEEVDHASIRSMFISDPGRKFLNVDLERADSWAVGLEVFKATGDRTYLTACSAKDLHTYVAKLVWPDLGWTDDEAANIKLAKQFFYRQYDYRFMCKKMGHGSNYLGSAWALATQMKIPLKLAQAGQDAYFKAFPAIRKWHHLRARDLQTTGSLTNLFGRRRNFHGRLDSNSTLKEAIAYLGQSVTARVINRAILKLWALQLQCPDLGLEFLAQVHDSALAQFPLALESEVIADVQQVMQIPITVTSPQGETVTAIIPLEASTGWNWASESASNLDGLRKFRPGKKDDRTRTKWPRETQLGLHARRLSGLHKEAPTT